MWSSISLKAAPLPDLGACVGVLHRNSLDDVDLALGQRQASPGWRSRRPVERPQVAPDQPHPADADDEAEQDAAAHGQGGVDDGRLLLVEARPDDDHGRIRLAGLRVGEHGLPRHHAVGGRGRRE